MFRITKIFATGSVDIYKIEGKVTDENLQSWAEQLKTLQQNANRDILLDLSQVWTMSVNAMAVLVQHLSSGLRVMNPSMDVRNMLHSSGHSTKVVE